MVSQHATESPAISYRTGIGIVCEAESLWPSGFRIVDEAEAFYLAGATEDVCDLLLGEAWNRILLSVTCTCFVRMGASAKPIDPSATDHMECFPQTRPSKEAYSTFWREALKIWKWLGRCLAVASWR